MEATTGAQVRALARIPELNHRVHNIQTASVQEAQATYNDLSKLLRVVRGVGFGHGWGNVGSILRVLGEVSGGSATMPSGETYPDMSHTDLVDAVANMRLVTAARLGPELSLATGVEASDNFGEFIDKLPAELIMEILYKLSREEIYNLADEYEVIRYITNDHIFWRDYYAINGVPVVIRGDMSFLYKDGGRVERLLTKEADDDFDVDRGVLGIVMLSSRILFFTMHIGITNGSPTTIYFRPQHSSAIRWKYNLKPPKNHNFQVVKIWGLTNPNLKSLVLSGRDSEGGVWCVIITDFMEYMYSTDAPVDMPHSALKWISMENTKYRPDMFGCPITIHRVKVVVGDRAPEATILYDMVHSAIVHITYDNERRFGTYGIPSLPGGYDPIMSIHQKRAGVPLGNIVSLNDYNIGRVLAWPDHPGVERKNGIDYGSIGWKLSDRPDKSILSVMIAKSSGVIGGQWVESGMSSMLIDGTVSDVAMLKSSYFMRQANSIMREADDEEQKGILRRSFHYIFVVNNAGDIYIIPFIHRSVNDRVHRSYYPNAAIHLKNLVKGSKYIGVNLKSHVMTLDGWTSSLYVLLLRDDGEEDLLEVSMQGNVSVLTLRLRHGWVYDIRPWVNIRTKTAHYDVEVVEQGAPKDASPYSIKSLPMQVEEIDEEYDGDIHRIPYNIYRYDGAIDAPEGSTFEIRHFD